MKFTNIDDMPKEYIKHEKKYPIHKKFDTFIYNSEWLDDNTLRIFCKRHKWEKIIKEKRPKMRKKNGKD